MKARTKVFGFEAEWIGGIEVMDLLELWKWVKELWQKLATTGGPLLLLYSPVAERAALRTLTAFARLSRRQEPERLVQYHWPHHVALLEAPPRNTPTLLLLHRSSRFLNLTDFCRLSLQNQRHWRVVLAMPEPEYQALSLPAGVVTFEVPAEEADYCARRQQEILAPHFGGKDQPVLSAWEKLLLAAGLMEVEVPVTLLGRSAQNTPAKLVRELRSSRWRDLLLLPPHGSAAAGHIAFRGRWLAQGLAAKTRDRSEVSLSDLIAMVNPVSANERHFCLQVLAALRAQGRERRLKITLARHAAVLQSALAQARGCPERMAWSYFFAQPCCQRARAPKPRHA